MYYLYGGIMEGYSASASHVRLLVVLMEEHFDRDEFCTLCGSILPFLPESGNIICYCCKKVYGPEVYSKFKSFSTVQFNLLDVQTKKVEIGDEDEGPVVNKKCPVCGNNKMSYATLQLRSADEGQTVFYTCTKCKYKELENS